MKKIAADWVFPVSSPPIKDGVVILDQNGRVLAVESHENHDPTSVARFQGVFIPGFINSHCHLELSHMKGVARTGTGLLPFLSTVVNFRNIDESEILEAIEKADQEMQDAGIVAVGDISNKTDTAATKSRSPIRYYTFVEMFDFMQESLADQTFQNYFKVFENQSDTGVNKKSCVPHAPYTVSKSLFQKINAINPEGSTISIHNQETVHENELFQKKKGDFLKFYEMFGFPLNHFEPNGNTSIHYALANMDPKQRTLFVHNTMTKPEDIYAAHAWGNQVYWATCPNANLYIENRLPNYQYFIDTDARMTIGTDSLTSNWQLSVLEEMKAIAKYQSYVPFETLLKWATLNGAEALGFEKDLGSIEKGKAPGINLLTGLSDDMVLHRGVEVRKIV